VKRWLGWLALVTSACGAADPRPATTHTAATAAGSSLELPASVRPPADQSLALTLTGVGSQVYECRASAKDAGALAWTLSGVRAELRDEAGQVVGRHFTGPTWEHKDGSRIVGEKKASADAPDAGAIPWLLLTAKETQGQGVLTGVQSVVRAKTSGGKPPPGPCDPKAGPLEVPYEASYLFFRARP
jgi:hypothetical protein